MNRKCMTVVAVCVHQGMTNVERRLSARSVPDRLSSLIHGAVIPHPELCAADGDITGKSCETAGIRGGIKSR